MLKYSDIQKNQLEDKDSLIKRLSESTGLSEDYIKPVYESMNYKNDMDFDKTSNDLWGYFMSNNFDMDDFDNQFMKIMKDVDNITKKSPADTIPKKIEQTSKSWLSLLKEYFGANNDIVKIIEFIIITLQLKNSRNKNIFESTNFGTGLWNHLLSLNESAMMDFKKYNETKLEKTPYIHDIVNDDLRFYDGLKYLLNNIYKNCDTDELKDVYSIMVNYMNDEIEYLTTKDKVTSTDINLYNEFLHELLTAPSLNIMYQNPEYLKTITPDLQTLMFDLIYIVNVYVDSNKKFNDYVDMNKTANYKFHTKSLLNEISSSMYSSKLFNKSKQDPAMCTEINGIITDIGRYNSNRLSIDCIMIIKGIQNEFNIKIRKLINNYISSALELCNSYKRVEAKTNNLRIMI